MQVTIPGIPASLAEFEALAAAGKRPEQLCALFLCALALFDKNKDAGIPEAQWAKLETLVRELDLAPYEAPDEALLDAPNSEVTITWTDGGEKIRCRYALDAADALDTFLRELAAGTQTPAKLEETE